jgi:aryl-alcohol dehydrogenase
VSPKTNALAAVIEQAGGAFTLTPVVLDDLREDEVLVRIEACGICHTDVKAQTRLELPAVLGHEGTGRIEAVGSAVSRVNIGDRVILSYPSCGGCPNCQRRQPWRCDHINELKFAGRRLDGSRTLSLEGKPISSAFFQQSAFATRAITRERSVVPVTGDYKPELLAALPCGVQTGAGAILNTLLVGAGDSLVVFGAGTVGLSAVMAARIRDAATIVAVDVVASRLRLAGELGATHTLHGDEPDLAARIGDILPKGARFTLDTTGNQDMQNLAVDCLAMGGECGLVAVGREPFPFHLFSVFSRAAVLYGVIQGSSVPGEFIPQLLRYHEQGRFPFDRLITVYDFNDINSAFADAAAGIAVKPVLKMNA